MGLETDMFKFLFRAARRNRRLRYTAEPLRVEYPYREAIGIVGMRNWLCELQGARTIGY